MYIVINLENQGRILRGEYQQSGKKHQEQLYLKNLSNWSAAWTNDITEAKVFTTSPNYIWQVLYSTFGHKFSRESFGLIEVTDSFMVLENTRLLRREKA